MRPIGRIPATGRREIKVIVSELRFTLRFGYAARRNLHRALTGRHGTPKLRRLRQTVCPQLFLSPTLCSASRVRIGFGVVLVVRIGFGVVFVAVNLAALPILLMLDLIVLSRRQMAAIRCAIGVRLVMDTRFVFFDV
jgi:hypothetical protein